MLLARGLWECMFLVRYRGLAPGSLVSCRGTRPLPGPLRDFRLAQSVTWGPSAWMLLLQLHCCPCWAADLRLLRIALLV